jgi:hypothetical protein
LTHGESSTSFERDQRWQEARRAAVDHVIGLISESPSFDSLVLRGSMAMVAWFPDLARQPGDIDFVVRPFAVVPLDELDPYPYLDRLDSVQLWPESAHGAGRSEMWTFEDFDTGGLRAHLPPEGLRWVESEDLAAQEQPHREVIERVRAHPRTATGVFLDADAVEEDATWAYADYGITDGGGGARLIFPWRADDATVGTLQLDFAYDEPLLEPPVLTAVPRGGGQPPVALWTASPGLSLAWKLQWLCIDQVTHGRCAGKDLYDAVLLAESDGMRLSSRVMRTVIERIPDRVALRPESVRQWEVDWSGLHASGTSQQWLDRLTSALESSLDL